MQRLAGLVVGRMAQRLPALRYYSKSDLLVCLRHQHSAPNESTVRLQRSPAQTRWSSASAADLRETARNVADELHARDLEGRLQRGSPFGTKYDALAARIQLLHSSIILHDAQDAQLITERIRKSFSLTPLSSADQASRSTKIEFEWQNERCRIPGMGPLSFSGKLIVDGNVVLDLSDVTTDVYMDALTQLRSLVTGLTAPALTEEKQREADWCIAFLCTHPSDYAFDAVSRALALEGDVTPHEI